MVDLDAYFARIGYAGPREPTLAVLAELQVRHTTAIPFEAIDVLMGRGVDLAPAAIDAKLIGARRGGYCFEQNSLFLRVLLALGFQAEGLLGRVLWKAAADASMPARTHMVLRVTIDGEPWLADVGFGTAVPNAPLRMADPGLQTGLQATFRLTPWARGLTLAADLGEGLSDAYVFEHAPAEPIDYEVGNWFTATHPSSHFGRVLMVTRSTADARYALLNDRLTIRRDGVVERVALDVDGIERALREVFGLPVEPAWRPAIARAVAAVPA